MALKFCAHCATELVWQIESGRERPVCPQCGFVVYRNPAPVGLIVATQDDKVLLVHRVNPPLGGYWAPPTGYIEMDESIEEGTARETKEETGLDVAVDKLLGLYSRANVGVMIAAFAGRIIGGAIAFDKKEVDAVQFFARDELPRQSAPTTGKLIDLWFYELVQEIFSALRAHGERVLKFSSGE
ncbi:MAG: NUDIX hydrolase [Chloroflexi bacterium]|nr:NUDIX hydrolase [Chloroflexota bacterium]